MELTPQDQSEIFELCSSHEIKSNDPLVAFLIDNRKTKNAVVKSIDTGLASILNGGRAIDHARDELKSSLQDQKEVVSLLHNQLKYLQWLKRWVFIGSSCLFFTLGFGVQYGIGIFWPNIPDFLKRSKVQRLNDGYSIEFKNSDVESFTKGNGGYILRVRK